MNDIKKTITVILVCLAVLISVYAAGFFTGNKTTERKYTDAIEQYQSRLADAENINRQLQDENSRINELNRLITDRLADITGRLEKAKGLVIGFYGQAETDGDTVQRIINNFQRLERALSIIYSK